MQRISAFFVAICMVLIAGSIGALLYVYFRLDGTESTIVAIAVLCGLALYNTVFTRLHDRRYVGDQIADLSRGTADLARQVGELARRLAAMEHKVEAAVDRAQASADPLVTEIEELGTLVRQLAESVAAHDAALGSGTRVTTTAAAPRPAPEPVSAWTEPPAAPAVPAAQPAKAPASEGKPKPRPTGALRDFDENAILDLIRGAVEANRIDLYLQPIVTLPQRKVRYYEATTQLRDEDGRLFPGVDFIPHAEAAGLMPKIDNLLVFRCVQVIRRLLLKNREIGLFCNLSLKTLADGVIFPQLLEFMEANRALAPSLVFEFTQSAVRAFGPIETEGLGALGSLGFGFAIDAITDLRIEGRGLADRGFRFIKAPAELLLSRKGTSVASDIHPADLSDLLGRFGIDLIAEEIENDRTVVDLLDHDVRFGQGILFSPPRPVRQEALQGAAGDLVATESSAVATAASDRGAKSAAEPAQRGLAQLARPVFAMDRR
ncbi:MAG: EAL domain-containing protein [Xanthobacteraceae bacterium]